MTITAEALLAAAAGKVVPKLPDDVRFDESGGLTIRSEESPWGRDDRHGLPPAVALALTVSAIEDALPADWRVVRVRGEDYGRKDLAVCYVAQRYYPEPNQDDWFTTSTSLYPTRAAALLELLGRLEARDAK